MNPPSEVPSYTLIAAEYTNLRAEIIKLVELQHQFLTASLVAVSAFITIGLQKSNMPAVMLIYPLVSLCIAVQWARDEFRIRQLARYIMKLENTHSELGWAKFLRANSRGFLDSGYLYSAQGIFLITQFATVGLAFVVGGFTLVEWVLIPVDLACMLATVTVINKGIKGNRTTSARPPETLPNSEAVPTTPSTT